MKWLSWKRPQLHLKPTIEKWCIRFPWALNGPPTLGDNLMIQYAIEAALIADEAKLISWSKRSPPQSLEEGPPSNPFYVKRRNSPTQERGEFNVQDTGTPIRSVKVDEDYVDIPAAGRSHSSSLGIKNSSLRTAVLFNKKTPHVLVSEDDSVNRAILKTSLEMDGHDVALTKDGSEVIDTFAICWRDCDITLMDLKVNTVCLPF